MPRKLRGIVRSVVQARAATVSAKRGEGSMLEIDLKAAADPAGKALAAAAKDRAKKDAGAENGAGRGAAGADTSGLVARKEAWDRKEAEMKSQLAEVQASRAEEDAAAMAAYLELVEERDTAREKAEAEARAKRLAEYQALQEAERRVREEEAAAFQQRQREAEARKATEQGTVGKKLDKFKKKQSEMKKKRAPEEAKRLFGEAAACLELVQMDCKTGTCTLETAEALKSAACSLELLQRVHDTAQLAEMGDMEQARSASALLYEIKHGLDGAAAAAEEGRAALANATEAAGAGWVLHAEAAKDALGRARLLLKAAGREGQVKARVKELEELQKNIKQTEHQAKAKQRQAEARQTKAGSDALARAKKLAAEGQLAAARGALAEAQGNFSAAGVAANKAKEVDAAAAAVEKAAQAAGAVGGRAGSDKGNGTESCAASGECGAAAGAGAGSMAAAAEAGGEKSAQEQAAPGAAQAAQVGVGLGVKPVWSEGGERTQVGLIVSKVGPVPRAPARARARARVGRPRGAHGRRSLRAGWRRRPAPWRWATRCSLWTARTCGACRPKSSHRWEGAPCPFRACAPEPAPGHCGAGGAEARRGAEAHSWGRRLDRRAGAGRARRHGEVGGAAAPLRPGTRRLRRGSGGGGGSECKITWDLR
jgi:hypothetical protein